MSTACTCRRPVQVVCNLEEALASMRAALGSMCALPSTQRYSQRTTAVVTASHDPCSAHVHIQVGLFRTMHAARPRSKQKQEAKSQRVVKNSAILGSGVFQPITTAYDPASYPIGRLNNCKFRICSSAAEAQQCSLPQHNSNHPVRALCNKARQTVLKASPLGLQHRCSLRPSVLLASR